MDCSNCKINKTLDQFYLKKNGKLVSSLCKKCYIQRYKKVRPRTIEEKKKHAEYQRSFVYKPNKDLNFSHKICSFCHKNKLVSEFFWDKQRHFYQSLCKLCKKNNSKEYRKLYRKKMSQNPRFRITQSLRSRVSAVVSSQKTNKSKKTMLLLGCNIDMFLLWLEYQFVGIMTMENYGKIWHLDHCMPCVSFDLLQENEQLKCFNWKNLRPCFAHDNLKKQSHVDHRILLFQEIKVKGFKKIHNIT